jgi:hypothetical protein
MPKKERDAETTAMQTIALLLAPLAEQERDRIVRWAYDRYIKPTLALIAEA